MRKIFNYFLSGVSTLLQFGKNGGFLKWNTDHFETRNPEDTDLAKLKIAPATEASDAVRYDQMIANSNTAAKGTLKELVFCMGKNGADIPNMTTGMLKRGAIIETVRIMVGEEFDGTPTGDFNLTINDDNNTEIFGLDNFMPDAVGIMQEHRINYILGEDIDVAANMGLTGGTKGDALITLVYAEPVLYQLPTGSELIFTPSRKIMHLDFLGEEGETTTLIIGGLTVICGIVSGNFVFDINDVTGQTHTFTTVGEEYTFAIDGKEYQIINETQEV